MTTIGQNIKSLREEKGISQQTIADTMMVSRPTYIAIENGRRDATIGELRSIAGSLGTTLEDLLFNVNHTSIPTATYNKFKQLILNCLQYGSDPNDKKITKTKLAKLVYLADFAWYYKHSTPMSGMSYRRIHQGPVADAYFRVIDELFETGAISIEQSGLAMMIRANEPAPRSAINDDELELIKRICEIWQGKSTSEIVDFTHEQVPWKTVKAGDIVPYELIKQESPDHIY